MDQTVIILTQNDTFGVINMNESTFTIYHVCGLYYDDVYIKNTIGKIKFFSLDTASATELSV